MDFLRISGKNHIKKKAKIFTTEEVNDFMTQAPNENRYWLVRKACVMFSLFGGLRGEELRSIDRSKVKPVTNGFEVTYKVSKDCTGEHGENT